ncbi:Sel1-like protein [Artemisia annua]|uniref:Sel1-like protein n=1 Tax=Artemisia annua TaxID=35608 RepID=A0A2U1QCE1_ARTAN|nr:Sel1-like protein [Artemisia annua]
MANKITTGFVSNVRTNGRHANKKAQNVTYGLMRTRLKGALRAYQKPENVKEGAGSVTWQAAKKAKEDIKGTMEWANEKMKKGTSLSSGEQVFASICMELHCFEFRSASDISLLLFAWSCVAAITNLALQKLLAHKFTRRYRYKKKLNYGMRLIFVMQLAGGNSTLTLAIFQRIFVMARAAVFNAIALLDNTIDVSRAISTNTLQLNVTDMFEPPTKTTRTAFTCYLIRPSDPGKKVEDNRQPSSWPSKGWIFEDIKLDSLEDFDHASQKIECVKKQNHLLKVLKFLIGGEENKEALRKSRGDEYKDFQIVEYQVQKGNTVAMYKIGISYYGLRGVSREHAKALSWFSKAVDKGEPRSLELLGKIYARDAAVTPNYTKAFECKHQNNNIFQL